MAEDTEHVGDGADLITRGFKLRSINAEKRTADFVASTDAVDTYGEIVDQDSWELDIYKDNPVVLFAHKSRELTIGKANDVGVKNGRLECTLEFAPEDANPEAERVWKLLQGGFLRAVSVGFIPRDYKWEKRDGKEVFVLYGNSLREISVTPVPANHEALAKMRARAMAERSAKNEAPSAQESHMDEATKKALEAKDAELKTARETIDERSKSLAEAVAANVKANSDRETATKAASEREASLKSALGCKADESLEDGAKRVAKELADVKAEKAALADKTTERDVDDLIGVKLAPAQKDSFLALAKSDRASFDAIVKDLPDLGLLGKSVIDPTKGKAPADGDLSALLGEGSDGTDGKEDDLSSLLND